MHLRDLQVRDVCAGQCQKECGGEEHDQQIRGHHSLYGVSVFVEANRPPKHGSLSSEPAPPEALTQHHHIVPAGHLGVGTKQPSTQRLDAEGGEEVAADAGAREPLRVAASSQIGRPSLKRGERLE